MFHVGQVVVCVNDEFKTKTGRNPVKGGVYTVRQIRTGTMSLANNDAALIVWLQEIRNSRCKLKGMDGRVYLGEQGFRASRFRPAVKTDISIFTEMLNKQTDRLETPSLCDRRA